VCVWERGRGEGVGVCVCVRVCIYVCANVGERGEGCLCSISYYSLIKPIFNIHNTNIHLLLLLLYPHNNLILPSFSA
jgi:hypothetical protein